MTSFGIVLRLKPGAYEEYKKRHDEIWPEMAEALEKHRVSMVIFRFGDELFAHVMTPSPEDWAAMGKEPVNARWNRFMAEVLETDGDGEIIFHSLPLAFAFGSFKER
jgi:L-rhamnose mutarotase